MCAYVTTLNIISHNHISCLHNRVKTISDHHPPLPSHAHLFAHLVSEAFLSVTHVLPVLLPHFVSTIWTVRVSMMVAVFLGAVLTVAFSPLGFVFAAHELVKLIVVTLPLFLLVLPAVVFVSLPASMLLSLLLVALRLASSGHSEDCTDMKLRCQMQTNVKRF